MTEQTTKKSIKKSAADRAKANADKQRRFRERQKTQVRNLYEAMLALKQRYVMMKYATRLAGLTVKLCQMRCGLCTQLTNVDKLNY